jgi:hypothetical protein
MDNNVSEEHTASTFSPEDGGSFGAKDGGSMFLRKGGIYLVPTWLFKAEDKHRQLHHCENLIRLRRLKVFCLKCFDGRKYFVVKRN